MTLEEHHFWRRIRSRRHKMFHFFTFCNVIWFGNCKSPFVNISCHLQWEKLPDFNAFPVNLHWREDSKFFPACWILIGQLKFPALQPYARLEERGKLSVIIHADYYLKTINQHCINWQWRWIIIYFLSKLKRFDKNLDPSTQSHAIRHFSASVQGTSRREWHQLKYVPDKKTDQGRC